ncbi:MAG: hypothetical protein PHW43_08170 [Syntrophales bacterium]|nr:hypothetical protein [Syntrophales bacterium]
MKEDWVSCCESCGFKPIVQAANEEEAIILSEQLHKKERNGCYDGPMILVAFKLSELNK